MSSTRSVGRANKEIWPNLISRAESGSGEEKRVARVYIYIHTQALLSHYAIFFAELLKLEKSSSATDGRSILGRWRGYSWREIAWNWFTRAAAAFKEWLSRFYREPCIECRDSRAPSGRALACAHEDSFNFYGDRCARGERVCVSAAKRHENPLLVACVVGKWHLNAFLDFTRV